MLFNVEYQSPQGVKRYCVCPMERDEAERQLANFKRRYLKADGTPRRYPNGKGFYPFTNPRIVQVREG